MSCVTACQWRYSLPMACLVHINVVSFLTLKKLKLQRSYKLVGCSLHNTAFAIVFHAEKKHHLLFVYSSLSKYNLDPESRMLKSIAFTVLCRSYKLVGCSLHNTAFAIVFHAEKKHHLLFVYSSLSKYNVDPESRMLKSIAFTVLCLCYFKI